MCFLIFCHTNSSYIKRKNVSRERINMYKDNKKYFDESYSEGCIGYIKSARKPMVFRPWDEWR